MVLERARVTEWQTVEEQPPIQQAQKPNPSC